MGSWDELCLVCGICPGGGPYALLSPYQLEDEARKIAAEIEEGNEKLVAIVKDALQASFSPDEKTLGFRHDWLPDGVGSVSGEEHHYATGKCIAIGYFADIGWAPVHGSKVPDGHHVQVRQVTQDSGGSFAAIVCTDGPWSETLDYWPSNCSTAEGLNPNFFVHERCYYYLKNWIAHSSLPPPHDGRTLSFAGELYEILNSREKQRSSDSALFPEVDYAGIEASLDQWQSFFTPCRRSVKHVKQAIKDGLRGKNLIPGILRDCGAWMFMRPDVWPAPSPTPTSFSFSTVGPPAAAAPAICNLPNEILLPILSDISITDVLSLSVTCRSARQLITEPSFLNHVLQDALLKGSCQYILPVHGLRDEEERAYEAIRLWLPESVRPASISEDETEVHETISEKEEAEEEEEEKEKDDAAIGGDEKEGEEEAEEQETIIPPVKPLLLDPQFPALAFIQACLQSDSMRNRRRLGGMVQQIEGVWRKYRVDGWEVDRFYPSEEIVADMHRDPVECRPVCEREASTA